MSGARPAAAPGLLAALTAAVPARLVRKLDQAPRAAEAWTWESAPDGRVTVTTEGRERVELRPEGGLLSSASQLSCSCLLAPRCLHLLAVAAALPVAPGEPAPAGWGGEGAPPGPGALSGGADQEVERAVPEAGSPPEGAGGVAEAQVTLGEPRRRVALGARRALAELLAAGASGGGLVLQGELLRAIHDARAAGLPRLAAALLAVLAGVRACRAEDAGFALPAYTADLLAAFQVAAVLARPEGRPAAELAAAVGVARREYAEIGSLRLHGLLSEPVVTSTGYAGVLTWLVATDGRAFTLSEIAPGDAGRVPGAYAGAARLGGGAVTHRELGRTGLHVEGATSSHDGRLGAGRGVRAVRAGPSRWDEPPLALRFAAPLSAQLDRAFVAAAAPPEDGAALDGLLCFAATVVGQSGGAVLLDPGEGTGASPRPLVAVPGDTSPGLPWRDNLVVLGRSPGLKLRCVARPLLDRPGRVALLAVEPLPPGDSAGATLALPPEWAGRCNLGLDRLHGAQVAQAAAPPLQAVAPPSARLAAAELAPLQRRLDRLALGGRSTIFPAAIGSIEEEARRLDAELLATGAAVLRALANASLSRGAGTEPLAEAWLAAGTYLELVDRAVRRSGWDER